MRLRHPALLLLIGVLLAAAACAPSPVHSRTTSPSRPSSVATSLPAGTIERLCARAVGIEPTCILPDRLRAAYDLLPLIASGSTGTGVTVVDVVSFGSPTLQQDVDAFDQQFGLPPIQVRVVAPLGTVPYDPTNHDMLLWALETDLDVEMIHTVAPGAAIVVLTSPVDETEGTIGLPQFLQLDQYVLSHHLGQVISQSWSASEATLADTTGQRVVQAFASFYQQATEQDITILTATGDQGATDFADTGMTHLASSPTVNFPADVPTVTAVGGTTLAVHNGSYLETAWTKSGGGVSRFFAEPAFQQGLPQSVQQMLGGHRGLPDVAADASPLTALPVDFDGHWRPGGGTSASTPLWAGIVAIADQVAGRPLGNINPGLYALGTSARAAHDFRDITSGNNSTFAGVVQVTGFPAAPGWDPVTGWGAPLASHLIPDLIAALRA